MHFGLPRIYPKPHLHTCLSAPPPRLGSPRSRPPRGILGVFSPSRRPLPHHSISPQSNPESPPPTPSPAVSPLHISASPPPPAHPHLGGSPWKAAPSSVVGYATDTLTGGKFYIKAAQFQDVQNGTSTLNTIMNGLTGVDFDEEFNFLTTAPEIQVQKSEGAGYDGYYFLNDAYIEETDSTVKGWADSAGNYVDLTIAPGVAYWFKVPSADTDVTVSGAVEGGTSVDVTVPQNKFTLVANAYPTAITLNGKQMTSEDIVGVDFDEEFNFLTTAPQIQVQKAEGAGYDGYYFLNDAYIEETDSTVKGWADSAGNFVSSTIPVGAGFWMKGVTGDVTVNFAL